MRVLITGGSGYIGSRLSQVLAERSDVDEIIDVDLRPPPDSSAAVRYVERSVTDDLTDLLQGVDIAMHLAWVLDPLADTQRQRDVCIGGTRRFLEACGANGTRHVFFMSSATAYGAHPDHGTPQPEDAPLLPEYHFQYSAEKREAEGLCRSYVQENPSTLLQIGRPAIVGGPNVSNFIFRLMDKKVTFRARGYDPELQIVHEDDVADVLERIVAREAPGAFNIAADGSLRVTEAASIMGARMIALPLPLLLKVSSMAWSLGLRSVTEAPAPFVYFATYPWLVSNMRVKEELGYRFRYDTRQTLQAFLESRSSSA